MTVERVMTFPLGGELRWALGGVVLGVAASVLPFDVLLPFALAGWPSGLVVRGIVSRSMRSAHVAFAACAFGVMGAAIAAPFGYRDEQVRISDTTLPLGQLAEELRMESLPWAEPVTLPSLTPTWREVEEAVAAQTPLRVKAGFCLNGITLLHGRAPITMSLEPAP